MKGPKTISLRTKILAFTLAVIVLLSAGVAVATRLILIDSLTTELKTRGIAIAQSVAERSRSYITANDVPGLVSLVFDTISLEERKQFISYVFILDDRGRMLANSFVRPFPTGLLTANPLPSTLPNSIMLTSLDEKEVYDIAVPVREGIYGIGAVHVGLSKQHMDRVVGRLRITYLMVITALAVVIYLVGHWSSTYITKPLRELTKVSYEISRGNLDVGTYLGNRTRCWEVQNCGRKQCPAYEKSDVPCWYVDETHCTSHPPCRFPEKLDFCADCTIFRSGTRDEVTQLADSFINMTRRLHSSQARLVESEEKYRVLFNSGPNPTFVLDPQSLEIIDVNPGVEETYGYARSEILGKPFTEVDPECTETLRSVRSQEEGQVRACVVGAKTRHYRKDGSHFYVNVHACTTRYGERDAMIISMTDLTDMIEKDTQLIQAGKMTSLGEMSAGVAHELNQPLNAIKMGSEYLKLMVERDIAVPPEDLGQVVSEISGQVDRAADIIHHLRDFSRKTEFVKREIDINATVRGALDLMEHDLLLRNVVVELSLDDTLPHILAHNNRLEQVFFNLLSNARDAIMDRESKGSDKGDRTVRIRSFRDADKVAVTVADSGTGIPEEMLHRIFEPFFTSKEGGAGMGLGLYITYGIVRDYGGDIRVESAPGRGTAFTVTFPAFNS